VVLRSTKFWPLVAYIATIFAANWAITTFGFVPVGFGLMAPAGVYFAGLAFTFRDLTQDALGRRWTYAAIIIGAGLSGFLSGPLAIASGVAFLFSETADFLVYTPLYERHWLGAVAASNAVGLVVDSALFLWLAFGSLDFLAGQIVGKLWVTAIAVVILWGWRAVSQRRDHPDVAREPAS
jgi:queuosine precursor transporter